MSPGFDFADFEAGARDQLAAAYPPWRALILELTD